jgi:antitoxin VapB
LSDEQKARLVQNGGSQAVRLPAEFRFEGDEVFVTRDEMTGDVILSARPRHTSWSEFIAWRDALVIGPDDADAYMSDRPLNRPVSERSVFEDEV